MSSNNVDTNLRPHPDPELVAIADYVCDFEVESAEALDTARNCLMDSLGCALLALQYPECAKHLGPIVQGTLVPNGAKVPGTQFQLDPLKAAWDIGSMVRWLDFNDTWLAAEWGHPSDNLGAILGLSDYLSRKAVAEGSNPLTVADVLHYMVKAHEIQGVLALENSFNRVGLDHVVLVKVASTAVAAVMLGANKDQVIDALSLAWVDGQSLRTYRHAPNTGSRKSWAAGDASSRGVRLAMMVMKGEMGLPSVLSAPLWGFYDVLFKGNRFAFQRPYGSYVMEQILFKLSFPAEFHAQTAVECAMALHPHVKNRLDEIERIEIVRGTDAVAYGPNAFLGVINIITRQAGSAPGKPLGRDLEPRRDDGARVCPVRADDVHLVDPGCAGHLLERNRVVLDRHIRVLGTANEHHRHGNAG